MGGQKKTVARFHLPRFFLALDEQGSAARGQHHPFILPLVVPLALGRCMSEGDDPLEPHALAGQQHLKRFTRPFRARYIQN